MNITIVIYLHTYHYVQWGESIVVQYSALQNTL